MALPSSHAQIPPRGKFANGPPRGKFMSPPSSTDGKTPPGGGGPRGKFLMAPPSAASGEGGGIGPNPTEHEGTKQKPQIVIPKLQPQPVFRDLEEAERLVLDLMMLASDTAKLLADYEDDFKEALLEKNGKEYMSKVERIHSLLSPHADLVVAYRNHAVDTTQQVKSDKKVGNENVKEDKIKRGVATSGNGTSSEDPVKKNDNQEDVKDSNAETEIDANMRNKNYNMYASRVEMRLECERRDVLKLLLEQEKAIIANTEQAVPSKRKREE